jgi:hypothetical protein
VTAPLALTLPLAVVLLVLAGGAALAARGGWTGSLRRDGRIGVRTPAALASDPAFALANKVAAPVYAGAAVAGLLLAAVAVLLPVGAVGAVVVFAIGLVAVVALAVSGNALGERAARSVPLPARKPGGGAGCGGCACGGGGCAGLTRTQPATPAV